MSFGIIAAIAIVVLVAVVVVVMVTVSKSDKTDSETAKQADENTPDAGKEASDEEKEAKEQEWKDLTEEVKFVCHGGKIQCKYCNPPIADMLATSTEVMLQDKPYMTVNDKDGVTNFNFMGLCMHPSQQKPLSPPPPCKSVISLGEWKDFSDTMIDDYNALMVKSTIPCMISGEALEIIHSGQLAELAEVKPPLKRNPKILETYWINADGERLEKIAPNKYVSLVIKTKDYRPRKDKLTIKIPIDGKEEKFETTVNGQGTAILKNVYRHEVKKLIKEPRIIEAYWRNENGERIKDIYSDKKAELFVRTEGYETGFDIKKQVKITLRKEKEGETFKNGKKTLDLTADINNEGVAIIKNFKKWM